LKSFAKRIVLSCALVCGSLAVAAAAPTYASAASIVKVQINDELVQFPDAQPFIDSSSNLQVPLRFLSEKLGYKVDWSMEGDTQVNVKLTSNQNSIMLSTGASQVIVNGAPKSLQGSAAFVEGRAFVPLRFISETFGSEIKWDASNQVAIIKADGKDHKSAYIAPPPPPPAPPIVIPSITDQIAQIANGYIGVPYVWGGTTPKGFDCSGFVQYVFASKGIDLPRTSSQMFSSGTAVKELKTGDLVFFANGSISHVGIYLGNGNFISATNHGVKVETLWGGYWGGRYVGAKRIV
jgi:cell wall-associated NlpC family hydrolase